MLVEAIRMRASDIHVEPYEKRFRVRFRIDGTLTEKLLPPQGIVNAFMQMFYYFLVYFYYWDAKKYPQVPVEDIARETRHFFAQGLYETNHWSVKRKTSVSAKSISLKFQNLLLRSASFRFFLVVSVFHSFLVNANHAVQGITVMLLSLALWAFQYVLYFLLLVVIVKYGWRATKSIWNR
jgi:hypothetical protein